LIPAGRWAKQRGLPRSLYVDRHGIYWDDEHPQKVTKKERLGDMLMEGVRELEAILASGRHPRDVLTVRTVAVIDAWDFNAKGLKALRKSLRMSTAVFAGVIGVSPKLVEQWESGRRKPSAMACRLLDILKRDPATILDHVVRGAA